MTRGSNAGLAGLIIILAVGCTSDPTPTPDATSTAEPSPSPSPSVEASASAAATATATIEPTPEPSLSLDLPEETDGRVVEVTVDTDIGDEEMLVTVTSRADERIDELVLRWPTELGETLFLAPFEPSDERIQEGGRPLVQEWTKWVVGPGERGEPAGTTSIGWGPLLEGATLEIPLLVTRRADGPVAFDFQVLAGNELLTLDGGEPAELRVEIP